jgi:DnaK suppressor protein
MRKTQLEKYRRRLEQKQDDISALVRRSGHAIRNTRQDGPEDSAAQAQNSYSKEFFSHQSDTNLSHLSLVEDTLRRINREDFGRCQSCDENIGIKRLNAVPWTRFCRGCQESAEETDSQTSRRDFSMPN